MIVVINRDRSQLSPPFVSLKQKKTLDTACLFLATKIVNVFGRCQHAQNVKLFTLVGRRYLFLTLCLSKLVSHNQLLFSAELGDFKTITKRLGKRLPMRQPHFTESSKII